MGGVVRTLSSRERIWSAMRSWCCCRSTYSCLDDSSWFTRSSLTRNSFSASSLACSSSATTLSYLFDVQHAHTHAQTHPGTSKMRLTR